MTATPMQHVLIIHEVADYPAWKKSFDGAADIRREAGERSYQVLKYQNDPNRIVHFSVWTSIDDAKRFFESPQLVRIRAEAGRQVSRIYLLGTTRSGHSVNFQHPQRLTMRCSEPLRASRHLLPPPPFRTPCRCRAELRGR